MRHSLFIRLVSSVVIAALLNLGLARVATAARIDTATVAGIEHRANSTDRANALARIDMQLGRTDVRDALVALGVDPAQATDRVAALTDAEVALLDRELAQLPAAGDGGWILLVVVLAVLVWLFATNRLRLN